MPKSNSITHGMSATSVYGIWNSMLQRCQNPSDKGYRLYGGRGIRACDRWRTFENFFADMGDRPPGMSLDRKDNSLGYEPSNCKWSTSSEQNRNRRQSVFLECDGVSLHLYEWADLVGLKPSTIHTRLRLGWSHRDAILTPLLPMSRTYSFRGSMLTIKQISAMSGVSAGMIYKRLLKGCPIEKAVSTPPSRGSHKLRE